MFKIENDRESFYQWDLNQRLIIEDKSINQVHFCNKTGECSLVCETYLDKDKLVVDVPNILLQSDWSIKVYAYCINHTKVSTTFKVITRSKPDDYVYTETEVLNWEGMKAEVEEMAETALEENKAFVKANVPKVIDGTNLYTVPEEERATTVPSVTMWAKDASGFVTGGGGVVLCDNLDGMILYGETDADKIGKIGQDSYGNIFADLKPAFNYAEEYTDKKVASILTGSASGEVIAIDDISPVSNKISVSFASKNLYYNNGDIEKVFNGITARCNYGESEITLNGTATMAAGSDITRITVAPGTYTFSVHGLNDTDKINLQNADTSKVIGTINTSTSKTFTFDVATTIKNVIVIASGNSYENKAIQIQIEKGSVATAYTPYSWDVTTDAGVNVCGKNILPYPYNHKSHTINGVTFTDNGDGSITANGTATGLVNFLFTDRKTFTLPAGTYSFSLTPQVAGSYYLFTGTAGGISGANGNRVVKNFEGGLVGYFCLQIKEGVTLNNVRFYPQIEVGDTITKYEPYTCTSYPYQIMMEEDYKVSGLYPYTTLMVDTVGTTMDVEYSRDLNKAFADLEQAIISLGGNV